MVIDFGDGVYEGEVVGDNVMHGRGKMTLTNGDVYVGDFRNDAFHGHGHYKWADGDEYSGEYSHDKQHGTGTLKDATGVFSGKWFEDERDGAGKQVYSNGEVYDGEWLHNMKHGRGKHTQVSGASYEGEWIRDMHHGTGISRNAEGDTYEGEFLNHQPHGKGTYKWADGHTYVGYFRNGVKHGEGCERRADGTWLAGNWVDGVHDQKQQVHRVDPGQFDEHRRLLQETLERLDLRAITPLPLDRLPQDNSKSDGSPRTIPGVVQPKGPDSAAPSSSTAVVASHSTSAAPPSASESADVIPPFALYSQEDFEDFQVMKLLGKGSFGMAYEAGLRAGKIVCVKIVELGNLPNETDLKNLKNEIDLMKTLNHPNIVQYYGCSEDKSKNTLNIFMEYVTGGTMNHYIKRFKTLPRDTVRQWAYQIVSGIKYLHSKHIVHRDIKGDNILVTLDGIVKVADFGCSKQIDDVCSKSHGCQTMVGTPYWMAPEVIKCEPGGYGTKSDVWSIGCTIVEMVTGKPPWPECNSMWAAVYKIANSKGLPTEIPKDLGEDMMDFLEKTFERDPAKRPSAEELLQHRWIAEFSRPRGAK
jgi:serine/threonine protein kinase